MTLHYNVLIFFVHLQMQTIWPVAISFMVCLVAEFSASVDDHLI